MGSDGSSPKNNLIIELLEKHGAAGKTASSTFPAELEGAVVGDLAAMGYKRTGVSQEEPEKAEPPAEKKPVTEEKKEEAVKPDKKPEERPARQADRPVQQGDKPRPAGNMNTRPDAGRPAGARPDQHGGQPQKKKKIIIVGGNAQPSSVCPRVTEAAIRAATAVRAAVSAVGPSDPVRI